MYQVPVPVPGVIQQNLTTGSKVKFKLTLLVLVQISSALTRTLGIVEVSLAVQKSLKLKFVRVSYLQYIRPTL